MSIVFRRDRDWNGGLFLFPVRRRVFTAALGYLLGILTAPVFSVPRQFGILFIVLFFCLTAVLHKTRRSALFPVCCILALAGNLNLSAPIRCDDPETPAKRAFSGTVIGIERDFRVILRDVRLDDGTALQYPAAVTLLTDEEEKTTPGIGQTVSGLGKLFRPDEQRNPGGQDARFRNLSRGYWLSGYLVPGWKAEGAQVQTVQGAIGSIRDRILCLIDAVFGESAPLYRALLAGDRAALDEGLLSAMREAGIIHILTISGMHISILGFVLSRMLKALRIRGILKQILVLCLVGVYALITGLSLGTMRACIMLFLRENAGRTGKKYDPLTALAVAFFALAVYRPAWVFILSFQFSFLIVLGIHLIVPALSFLAVHAFGADIAEKLPARTILFCVSAQLAAIPVQLMGYGAFSLFALPFNLAASVLIPFMIVGGLFCLVLSVLFYPLASLLAALLKAPAMLLEQSARLTEVLPWGTVRLPAPEMHTLVFLAFAAALCCPRFRFGRMRKTALALFLSAAAIGYALRFDPAPRYVQLDVGQGDACILRAGRHSVLYDTGPASSYDLLNYLRHEGLTVDAVFLSHLDEDHAGGLLKLLRSEIRIGRFFSAEKECGDDASETVREAWSLLPEKGIARETLTAGSSVQTGKYSFQVLGPTEKMRGDNARSLLLLTEMEGARILLTGDLPISSEPMELPDIELLKVAHHGGKKSTSTRFLEATSPALSLISVGARNSFGHPAERVLNDLKAAGSSVFRTDRCGCITVFLKPHSLRVQPFLREPGAEIGF